MLSDNEIGYEEKKEKKEEKRRRRRKKKITERKGTTGLPAEIPMATYCPAYHFGSMYLL